MKKYILICLAITLIAQACKKENIHPGGGSKPPVVIIPDEDEVVVPDEPVSTAPVTGELQASAVGFVYRKVNVTTGYNKHLFLDVDADGKTDYNFVSVLFMENNKPNLYLLATTKTGSGNKILIQKSAEKALNSLYTFPVNKGDAIKPATTAKTDWSANSQKGLIEGSSTVNASKQYFGLWKNQQDKYLGIKFIIKGKAYYGWIKLSHNAAKDEILVSEYAYNKAADQPILAGQK